MKTYFSIFLIVYLSGCASFNSGKNANANFYNFHNPVSKSVLIEIEPVARVNIGDKIRTYKIDNRLQSYGMMDLYAPETIFICPDQPCDQKNPEIKLFIEYSSAVDRRPILALEVILFIVTLGLYPAHDAYDIQLNAVAVDSKNNIIGKYTYSDTVKVYYQLFLPFISPFMDTSTTSNTISNLTQLAAIQADLDHQQKKSNLK